jgi:hypothetical protein
MHAYGAHLGEDDPLGAKLRFGVPCSSTAAEGGLCLSHKGRGGSEQAASEFDFT